MIVLTRIDAARNMRRFYKLCLTRTLFDEWAIIREWGRIGRSGTVRTWTYPGKAEAATALRRSVSWKLKRGYIPVSSSRERHAEAVD